MSGIDARTAILAAIRTATRDVPAGEPPAWSPDEPADAHGAAAAPPKLGRAALLELAAERISDYRATVTRVADDGGIGEAIAGIVARHGARQLAVPVDLPAALRPLGATLAADGPVPLSNDRLGAVDGVLTTCALAIADTGTIVLDAGPGQGRRTLTLLPDLHICVIRADQVVHTVPEAIERLATVSRPITFISGPSATSDIELERVEGVHGPRRLEVVLAG